MPFDLTPLLEGASPVSMLLAMAMLHLHAFILLVSRFSGLFLLAPALGQSVVPVQVRVMMCVLLAFIVAPVLPLHTDVGFHTLDANESGVLEAGELSPDVAASIQERSPGPIDRASFTAPAPLPRSLAELSIGIVSELLIGLMIGFAVRILMSALQLAGEMIDQQTGIALGGVFNPGLDLMAGVSGQFLYMLGIVVMLCMEPVGGHLRMIDAVVRTCQLIPLGTMPLSLPWAELLTTLLSQSFVLVIQIIAPFLAAMSLVSLTLGYLGYSVPQINVMQIGFSFRAFVNILILGLIASGVASALAASIPDVIDSAVPFLLGGGNGGG